jgi:hypothetical protein
MKRMMTIGVIMLFAVQAVMAAGGSATLGENNVIVQKADKVTIKAVKSARVTTPVDWMGMKASILELALTAEGNVCPAYQRDVAFVLNSSGPTNFRGPETLQLFSYYKYPVDFACALYSEPTDVIVRIQISAAGFDSFDKIINIPVGVDGRDGVKKITVSVRSPFTFSVQIN